MKRRKRGKAKRQIPKTCAQVLLDFWAASSGLGLMIGYERGAKGSSIGLAKIATKTLKRVHYCSANRSLDRQAYVLDARSEKMNTAMPLISNTEQRHGQ